MFTTNIRPNCYVPLYKSASTAYTSPLHFTGISIKIPQNSYYLASFFNNVLSYAFTNQVQASVSFSVNTSLLTGSNLSAAMNAIIYALQVYYYFDSIEMYYSNPQQRNDGVSWLRAQMTPTDYNNLYILRRTLLSTPIPPRLLQVIFYLSQTFQSSSMADAPLIKFIPVGITSSGYASTTEITTAYTNLQSYQATYALISRAAPHWLVSGLPHSEIAPICDPQFHTMWCNSPYYVSNTGTPTISQLGPSASTNDGTVAYNSFTNTLDGGIYAFMGILNSTDTIWSPSLSTPFSSTVGNWTTNRWSYDGTKMVPSASNQIFVMQRNETYSIWPSFTAPISFGPVVTTHQFGTERVYGVTGNTVTQSSYEMLEFMLSLDTFKVKSGYTGLGQRKYPSGNASTESKKSSSNKPKQQGRSYKKTRSKNLAKSSEEAAGFGGDEL